MNTTKQEKIQEIYEEVLGLISEIELEAVKNNGYDNGWTAIRVNTDGEVYRTLETSPCYSESEYYGKNPHNLTLWSVTGRGSFCTPLGEGGVEVCEVEKEEFEEVTKKIEEEYPDFREWDDSEKHDLYNEYSEKEWRPCRHSETGYGFYDENCGWVDQPDFDENGEILKKLEEWAVDNLLVEEEVDV